MCWAILERGDSLSLSQKKKSSWRHLSFAVLIYSGLIRDMFTSSLTENMVPLKEDQKTYELNPNSLTERNFEVTGQLHYV